MHYLKMFFSIVEVLPATVKRWLLSSAAEKRPALEAALVRIRIS